MALHRPTGDRRRHLTHDRPDGTPNSNSTRIVHTSCYRRLHTTNARDQITARSYPTTGQTRRLRVPKPQELDPPDTIPPAPANSGPQPRLHADCPVKIEEPPYARIMHRRTGRNVVCQNPHMQTTAPPNVLQHLWKATLGAGIVSVLLGAITLAWPGKTILVAALVFSAYLLVTGASQVILALSLRVPWGMRLLLFIGGIAAVALVVLCFLSLQDSVLLLSIWIGLGWIFRGVATATSAIADSALPGRVWEIVIGVVSLLAGIIMLALPFESLATLTLVVAIGFLVVGAFESMSAFGIRVASKATAEVDASLTEEPETEPEPKPELEAVTSSPAGEKDAS